MQKILFVSHNASRTGAPLILRALVQWLNQNSQIESIVLFREGGDLLPDFVNLCKTYVYPVSPDFYYQKDDGSQESGRMKKIKIWLAKRRMIRELKLSNFQLLYNNSGVNGTFVEELNRFLTLKVISHVHELEYVLDLFGKDNWRALVQNTDHFVVSTEAVKKLCNQRGITDEDISLNEYFADMHFDKKDLSEGYYKKVELTIVSAGTVEWRKGTDIFLQVAAKFIQLNPGIQVRFIWVGGPLVGQFWEQIQFDIKKLQIEDLIHFTGYLENPGEIYQIADIFISISREEPFGMVAVEAAMHGAAIICFDKSGGMAEFVRNECGVSVPYLNIEESADAILKLYNAPEMRTRLSKNAMQKIEEKHTLNLYSKRFLEIIENQIVKDRRFIKSN